MPANGAGANGEPNRTTGGLQRREAALGNLAANLRADAAEAHRLMGDDDSARLLRRSDQRVDVQRLQRTRIDDLDRYALSLQVLRCAQRLRYRGANAMTVTSVPSRAMDALPIGRRYISSGTGPLARINWRDSRNMIGFSSASAASSRPLRRKDYSGRRRSGRECARTRPPEIANAAPPTRPPPPCGGGSPAAPTWPPNMKRALAAWFTIGSITSVVKSMNIMSATGLTAEAAPTAAPSIAFRDRGIDHAARALHAPGGPETLQSPRR